MSAADPPRPYAEPFRGGIVHPDLYLWDAWSCAESDGLHLYCLAVNRVLSDGTQLLPADRNNVAFHVRHFHSRDGGRSWTDKGCLIAPRSGERLPDSRTIWSGSVEPLPDGVGSGWGRNDTLSVSANHRRWV